MRCDDDYVWGGGLLRGPYDPDVTTESIRDDFQVFCLLAARRGVLPANWNWPAFLAVASQFVCFAFDKSEAQARWGGENVFAALMGNGRSLRYTAEMVYGTSCQQQSSVEERDAAEDSIFHGPEGSDDYLNAVREIGGTDAWKAFSRALEKKRRTIAF